MTGIIFRGLEQENFSILKFYVARANRIIPALTLLCLVLWQQELVWLPNIAFSDALLIKCFAIHLLQRYLQIFWT